MVSINESMIKIGLMSGMGYAIGCVAKVDPKLMAAVWLVGAVAGEALKRISSLQTLPSMLSSIGVTAYLGKIGIIQNTKQMFFSAIAFAFASGFFTGIIEGFKTGLQERRIQQI